MLAFCCCFWHVCLKHASVSLSDFFCCFSDPSIYHLSIRLSIHPQAGLKLLKDRRVEMALRAVSKLGEDLSRVTELLEDLSGQVGGRGRLSLSKLIWCPLDPVK